MAGYPAAFLSRMEEQLCGEYAAFLASLQAPPTRCLRVNTLKITPKRFMELLGLVLTPADGCAAGDFVADERAADDVSETERAARGETDAYFLPDGMQPGRDPLHAAGLYYVQEASAQMPVRLLDVQPGEAVLDLCAAPGGKSTQIAAALAGTGVLVANEPVAERANILVGNLERLGVRNALVSCMTADALCKKLPLCFDKVLVDAPCSGEGMFRKDGAARLAWSPEHVLACAVRQAGILESAAGALRGGGTLVYSTCTFSREENEGVIESFLAAHPEFSLSGMRRLYPHTSCGEGQFMAKLVKCDTGRARLVRVQGAPCAPFADFCKNALTRMPEGAVRCLPDGRVLLLPQLLPAGWETLRIKRAGVLAGEIRGERFLPDHALFLALPAEWFTRRVPLAGALLTQYFAGQDVPAPPSLRGYAGVIAEGYCVGFGKAAGGTLKNHYPKGLRVICAR